MVLFARADWFSGSLWKYSVTAVGMLTFQSLTSADVLLTFPFIQAHFPFICASHEYYYFLVPRPFKSSAKKILPPKLSLVRPPHGCLRKKELSTARQKVMSSTQTGSKRAKLITAKSRGHRFQCWNLSKLTWRTKARVQRTDRQETSWPTNVYSYEIRGSWNKILQYSW